MYYKYGNGYVRPTFSQQSFTNEYGQEIYPGDQVVAVTTSWHQSDVKLCTFLGVNLKEGEVSSVRVKINGERKYSWQRPSGIISLPLKRIYKIAPPTIQNV